MRRVHAHVGAEIALLLSGLVLLVLPLVGFGAEPYTEIGEVKLTESEAPDGWVLQGEMAGGDSALEKFEQLYGVEVDAILNQIFSASGESVQVNYVLLPDPLAAEVTAAKMAAFTQSVNPVVLRGNTVTEVISENPWHKQAVLEAVDLKGLKDVVVTERERPANWKLSFVVLVDQSQLPIFENKLGGSIDGVFNQVFQVDEKLLRLNYISAEDDASAEALSGRMSADAADAPDGRTVVRKGTVVVEILSQEPSLLSQAVQVLE